MTALVEACARDRTPAGARDAAMLACLYVGGLRRAELAALKVEHYAANSPTLTVKSGKGDKDRVVPLEPSAAVAVDAWLRVRGARPGRLFLPVNKGGRIRGEDITAGAVYNALARRAAEAKIAHASPHDLRRSFVVICTKCGHHNAVDRQRARSGGVVMPETLEPDRQST